MMVKLHQSLSTCLWIVVIICSVASCCNGEDGVATSGESKETEGSDVETSVKKKVTLTEVEFLRMESRLESELMDRALSLIQWQVCLFERIFAAVIALGTIAFGSVYYINYRRLGSRVKRLGERIGQMEGVVSEVETVRLQAVGDIERLKGMSLFFAEEIYSMLAALKDMQSKAMPGLVTITQEELRQGMIGVAMLRIEMGEDEDVASATDVLNRLGMPEHIERLEQALRRVDLTRETKAAIEQAIDDIRKRQVSGDLPDK